MIDQTERGLARAIAETDAECIRLRETEGATQEQIDAADSAWLDANEAYTAAGSASKRSKRRTANNHHTASRTARGGTDMAQQTISDERYAELRRIYMDAKSGEITDVERKSIREFIEAGEQLADRARAIAYAEYRKRLDEHVALRQSIRTYRSETLGLVTIPEN